MNHTASNPTDILGHLRAESVRAEQPFLALEYLKRAMGEKEGRAFLWSLLVDAGTWGRTDPSDVPALGIRNWGAALLDRMLAIDPRGVASMWVEAMDQLVVARHGAMR